MDSIDNSKRSRLWLIPLVAIPLIYSIFLYPSPEYCVFNKNDAAFFLTLGINLAEHGRYTTDTFPVDEFGRHATWPFIFPCILAGVVKVFGVSWVALKLLMVSLGLLGLYLMLQLWREDGVGKWAVSLTALNPVYFLFSHQTMSEVPFMVLNAGTLLAMSRSKTFGGAFLAGCLAVSAFYTRGYAVVFVPAAFLYYAFQRDTGTRLRSRVLMFTCFAIPLIAGIVGWRMWTDSVIVCGPLDAFTTHYGNFASLPTRLETPMGQWAKEFYWYHLRSPVYLVAPLGNWNELLGHDWISIPGSILFLLAALGWLRSVIIKLTPVHTWLPFAIGLLIVVGGGQPRYWLTYLPFIFYYVLFAVDYLAERFMVFRSAPVMARGLLLISGLLGLALHLHNPDKIRFLNGYWRDYRDLGLWCRLNLPDDAVIVTHTSANMFVTSCRRTLEWRSDTRQDLELARSGEVYLVCPPQNAVEPLAQAAGKSCRTLVDGSSSTIVHQHGGITLYRYVQDFEPPEVESR